MKQLKTYITHRFELIVWISGLLMLAFSSPHMDTHFSLCLFKWAGFQFCPGCGLGHSITWLFHGDLQRSLQAHPLGIVALVILLTRIYTLTRDHLTISKNKHANNR